MNKEKELGLVETFKKAEETILKELKKVIVGQEKVIEEILIALMARGHCLLIGVPGLAKTLLVKTIAQILDLEFKRIQFTPDLMPSDITGTDIIQENPKTGQREFVFMKGPIFGNILLADEINRTPPKTQSALLEAMQEQRVTAAGKVYPLSPPFFVLATQNPIEQEGTYPLPEAQLDRFMFNIFIEYPNEEEEIKIVKETTSAYFPQLKKVMNKEEILDLQEMIRRVPVADSVVKYAIHLVRASRPHPKSFDFINRWVSWGAGPRASQYLILGAKTRAIMQGRFVPAKEDIQAVAYPVLRHRILTNFQAEAEGITSLEIIKRLLEKVSD